MGTFFLPVPQKADIVCRYASHSIRQPDVPRSEYPGLAQKAGTPMPEIVLAHDYLVQFGGAAGTLDGLGARGAAVRKSLAGRLQLADAPQWHSQRDRLAELNELRRWSTAELHCEHYPL